MKFRVSLIPFLGRACVVSLFLMMPAFARDATLESLIEESRTAMREKNWEQALESNTQAITRFGSDQAYREYGAQFGIIHYRKGLCEMKLKRWKEAMISFETCYRDFPNEGADTGNTYQKLALRKWAESAMGAEDWSLALAQFAKFLAERDKVNDTFPQGSYYINLAICHYKLGDIVQGSESLEIAIRNKTDFPTPDLGIIAGFQALVSAAIADGNEQALLDFIGKNRGTLLIEPYEMYQFSPVFMKLAGDAIGVGMRRAAMELYQFIPSTDVAIDDVRARLRSMGAADLIKDANVTLDRKQLEADLATFEADRRGKRATESIKLAAVAFLHESSGNFLGAYAAYQQLELYYPGSEKREEYLFNLIRVASRVGRSRELRRDADTFLMAFPESPRIGEMRELVLSTLLEEGDPAKCIEVASPMLELLAEGTPEHELCTYLLGVAYFNSGLHEKAKDLLALQIRIYPQGGHATEAAYYLASDAARLGQWEEAATLFDSFLTKHPDSPYFASALYERASCYFQKGRPDAAREKIQRLTKEFPDSPVTAQAYHLLGKVELAAGKPDDAEKAYLKALEAVTASKDQQVIGDVLCSLVELLARYDASGDSSKRMKKAVGFADRYWKDHAAGSACQTQVAVAQVSAFVKVGRGDEALERLRGIVASEADKPGGNSGLIESYAEAYLGSHSTEELAAQFEEFPGIDPSNKRVLARLQLAVIRAFENEARDAKDGARKQAAAAMVKTLYQKLKTGFTPEDLDSQTLIRLGDHLRLNTSTPREALVCYEEVIGREDVAWRNEALLGRADVRVRSAAPEEIDLGIAGFKGIYKESKDAGERGYSMFRIVEALMAKGDFASAVGEAGFYLNEGGSEFVPQLRLMLARSYQELGSTDEAINEYARVWSTHTDDLGLSAPAMNGWMQLVWARNRDDVNPPDRQSAYDEGMRYLDRTRELVPATKDEDLGAWHEVEQAVKTFGTSPGIKSAVINGEPDDLTKKRDLKR